VSLILSDVLGSPLDVIASGPTAPDSTTFADALAIIQEYKFHSKIPNAILAHLERGARGEIVDTPKAGAPLFARVTNVIIADNTSACEAAEREAEARGYNTSIFSTQIQGAARGIAHELAGWAANQLARRGGVMELSEGELWEQLREHAEHLLAQEKASGESPPDELPDIDALARNLHQVMVESVMQPACMLMGGETTVVLRGNGLGGRAQELALAAAPDIAGDNPIVILSAGTDGNDGPTDAAGALADNTTLARAKALGLDAEKFLENNDAYHFFQALDDLIITGPTNTNVNDLMLALVG
jgi:hydroxypyruvate reductase